MTDLRLSGFGGTTIAATSHGDPDAPAVVLVPGAGQTRALSADTARALALAGRHAIAIDPRPAGADDRSADDPDAHAADLRALLATLGSRPVVVGAGAGGAAALLALGENGGLLATGLVLVDTLLDTPRLEAAAAALSVPVLAIGSAAEPIDAALLDFLERAQPLGVPEYREGSDARTLRDALGCFATGVTLITARAADGTPVGLTANSFTSLSLDPPLLLVCIARSSSSIAAFEDATQFAVSVLQIGQQLASTRFAKRDERRFLDGEWEDGENGVPLLKGALVNFECARHAAHDGGDHIILVGRVTRARFEPRRDPLLYFRGKYRALHFS